MEFNPKAYEKVSIFNKQLEFQPPKKEIVLEQDEAYVADAGSARVYKVKDTKGKLFALKVFKEYYRPKDVTNILEKLNRIKHLPGTTAANRYVNLPTEIISRIYPELVSAMLIPWIQGETLYDIMYLMGAGKLKPINVNKCLKLCEKFLQVISSLEEESVAHTDISPDNIIVDMEKNIVELIDLENIFLPSFPEPPYPVEGKENYKHPSIKNGQTLWFKEADRYSTALLAADLLILSSRELSPKLSEIGFFTSSHTSVERQNQFNQAKSYLDIISPPFSILFEKAWESKNLKECPTINQLLISIQDTLKAKGEVIFDGLKVNRKVFPKIKMSQGDAISQQSKNVSFREDKHSLKQTKTSKDVLTKRESFLDKYTNIERLKKYKLISIGIFLLIFIFLAKILIWR